MNTTTALLSFVGSAGLLTVTPGLDTALVVRTATSEGTKSAAFAAIGINVGCLLWGSAVAVGLGTILAASEGAYDVLRFAGGAYLCWLGVSLLLRPRTSWSTDQGLSAAGRPGRAWFLKGFLGNILNPKIGIFYVSFLPQFVPEGADVRTFIFLLTVIHVMLGFLWCALLISLTRPMNRWLRTPGRLKLLDRMTGLLFVGFGLKLAAQHR